MQPSQERLPRAHRLFEDQDDDSDPEPDRDSEEVVRAVPADEPAALRARGRGPAVGVQVGLPDQRLPRELVARVHRVFDRQLGVQVRPAGRACTTCASRACNCGAHAGRRSRTASTRCCCPRCGKPNEARGDVCDICGNTVGLKLKLRRRRVPGARHDLRRAAQGHDPARRLEQGSGDGRQDHPRHQGAGGLLRRHPADDGQRHVHHQRHRARHRRRSSTARRARSSTPKTRRSTSRRSSRIAGRGWSSSTTRRTCCYVRIDRKRKFLATVFLRALGLRGADEIIRTFYTVDRLHLSGGTTSVGGQRQPRRAARGAGHRRSAETRDARRQEDHARTRSRRCSKAERRVGRSRPTPSSRARSRRPTSSIRRPAKSSSRRTRS